MPLIGGGRWGELLKNAFGVRGPYAPTLDPSIMPTLDLGGILPVDDDSTLHWCLTVSQPAVAAQFSLAAFNIPQGRAIIDGILTRAPAAAFTFRGAYTTPFGGVNAVVIRNLYGGPAGPPLNHFTSAVRAAVTTQVADPLAGATNVLIYEPQPAQNPFVFSMPIVLFPGQDFTFATGAVNTALSFMLWGRAWPSYPE